MDDVVSAVRIEAIDDLNFAIAAAAPEHVKSALLMRPRIRPPCKPHDVLGFRRSDAVRGNLRAVKLIPAKVSDRHIDNIYINRGGSIGELHPRSVAVVQHSPYAFSGGAECCWYMMPSTVGM